MKNFAVLLFILFTTAAEGMCVEEIEPSLREALKVSASEPNFMTVAGALFFVIFLIYITGLIYSKLNAVGAKTVKKQIRDYDLSKVTILSTTQLGQGRNLHVIQVDNKHLLIGSTNESIRLIKDLDEELIPEPQAQPKCEEAESVVQNPEEDFGLYKKYLK